MPLSITQLAYLAGLIDGEGSLGCQKQIGRNRLTATYRINDEPLTTIGQWLSLKAKIYDPPNRLTNHSLQTRLRIPKGIAIPLLRSCLPYLILKRRQAELVIRIEEIRSTHTPNRHLFTRIGSKPMPAAAVAQMDELWHQLRSLKSNKRSHSLRRLM